LYDPNVGAISACPYILQNDANSVIYEPCGYYRGYDSFTFKVNDGGIPPTGGDSNIAAILLDVTDRQIGSPELPSPYPLHTSRHACRMQILYTAAEIGDPFVIGGIWLNIVELPCSVLRHFTMRMQPTAMSEYPADKDFVDSGWTTVYQNDELITSTGWYRFDFDTPYDCNEPNNLLLDISFNNAAAGTFNGSVSGNSDPNRVIAQVSDSRHGDPLQWTAAMFGGVLNTDIRPAIRLIYHNPDVCAADFDANCRIDVQDLLLFAEHWLAAFPDSGYNRIYDIGKPVDAKINLEDFAKLAVEWLRQNE
jgi:hypothetical protein